MPAPNALKRRLSLAFEFKTPDAQDLTTGILALRAETWRSTLTTEARAAGSNKSGQGPNGNDLSELSRMSREDASSIVQTFNRELGNQIDRLYDAQPNGNRAYYIRELTAWADRRAEWKDRQIATNTHGTTRMYAQERFNKENRSGESLYLFTGPPAREIHCQNHFDAGLVNREYVERNPTPIHLNCPHVWDVQVTMIGVPINQIWVG